jgi:hypothetical protein
MTGFLISEKIGIWSEGVVHYKFSKSVSFLMVSIVRIQELKVASIFLFQNCEHSSNVPKKSIQGVPARRI